MWNRLFGSENNNTKIDTKISEDILDKLQNSHPSLKELNLSLKGLKTASIQPLCQALKGNTSLRTLDLGSNSITDEGAKYLEEALKENISLQTLSLGQNVFTDEGAKYLAAALKKNTSLQTLSFWGNYLTDEGAKYLAGALKKNTSLRSLILGENKLTDEGAKYLAEALKENTSLQTLELFGNKLGDEGKKYLEQIESYLARNKKLAEQCKNLASSNNNHAWWQPTVSTQSAVQSNSNALQQSIHAQQNQTNNSVQQNVTTTLKPVPMQSSKQSAATLSTNIPNLILSTYVPAYKAPAYVGNVITIDKNELEKLRRNDPSKQVAEYNGGHYNGLTDADIQAICKALENNRIATMLSFTGLRVFGRNGTTARYLKELLEKNAHLCELQLARTDLNDMDMEILAEGLKKNTGIKALYLSCNKLTDMGLVHLAKVIEVNKNITMIWYIENKIDVMGMKQLAQALEKNRTLQYLDFKNCTADSATDEEYKQIKEYRAQIDAYLARNKKPAEEHKKSVSSNNNNAQPTTPQTNSYASNNNSNYGASYHSYYNSNNNNNNARPQTTASAQLPMQSNMTTSASPQVNISLPPQPYRPSKSSTQTTTSTNNNNNNTNQNTNNSSNNNNTPTPSEQFALWANPQTTANLAFLGRLSPETKQYLENLKPDERKEIHAKLNELVKQQAELRTTLDPVIRTQQANAQLQQAIQVINQNSHTKMYFETLLRTMDEALLASLVIGSGKVAQAQDLASRVFNGATQIASFFCPPAAPFLGLVNQVVNTAGNVSDFRDTKKLMQWVKISSDIPTLSLALAVACTKAKQAEIKRNDPIDQSSQDLLTRLKHNCQSLFEQFKAGERFERAKERAILDAYTLLDYMMTQEPRDTAQEKKVAQLVGHLTGQAIIQTPLVAATTTAQTLAPTPSAQDLSALLAKMQALELKQKETEEALRLAREETQASTKFTQEQAEKTKLMEAELAAQKAKTQELEKRQSEHSQRNELFGSPRDDRQHGPQIQIEQDALKHPTLPQHVATSELFATLYFQSQKHETTIETLVQATTGIQDNVAQIARDQEELFKLQEQLQHAQQQNNINESTRLNLRIAELEVKMVQRQAFSKS